MGRLTVVLLGLLIPLATLAEPIPPLPLAAPPRGAFVPEPDLPEEHSPCTIDVDAGWIAPLKTTPVETVRLKIPKPVNCDGAVLSYILATGNGSVTSFQFTVGFRPGRDRDGTITFAILDTDKQPVAMGEVTDNLDEGDTSYLGASLKIKNRDFDSVFAPGKTPVLRITVRIGGN